MGLASFIDKLALMMSLTRFLSHMKMALKLIPAATPDEKQALIERIKRPKREPGVLQCAKCGGRDTMTVVSGSYVNEAGRLVQGTVTSDKVCYHCDKKGILSFMLKDPPKLVKQPKPRRTKPRSVK